MDPITIIPSVTNCKSGWTGQDRFFLAETLPHNLGVLATSPVVVTDENDAVTADLCNRHKVPMLFSCAYRHVIGTPPAKHRISGNGEIFNRGALINDALRLFYMLDCPSRERWILILDGDILLDPRFRDMPDPPDESAIYGCTRILAGSEIRDVGYLDESFLAPADYRDFSDRRRTQKPRVCGFFQLFHSSVRPCRYYPECYPTAEWSDTVFSESFPASGQLDMACIHLGRVCTWHNPDPAPRRKMPPVRNWPPPRRVRR